MLGTISDSGVTWAKALGTGDEARIQYTNIRRERTGMHAVVAVGTSRAMLAYDEFNIHRSEERRRLAKAAFEGLGDVTRECWGLKDIEADLLLTSAQTPKMWESDRITVETYGPEDEPGPVQFRLRPFILDGGATLFFAPPKSGKSYLMQTMAISISLGISLLWDVPRKSPVLFVNLERSRPSVIRRELALMRALGRSGRSGVEYIQARGWSLAALASRIREWGRAHQGGGVLLDSISRTRTGDLNENEAANRYIDMMHELDVGWWAAIAHTPRSSSSHVFGSVHFDAAADVLVKVAKERQQNVLGLALSITEANDIGHYDTEYLAFEFEAADGPVYRVRMANADEFPELSPELSEAQEIESFIRSNGGSATTTQLATGLGKDASNVSKTLRDTKRFVKLEKRGREQPYGLVTQRDD